MDPEPGSAAWDAAADSPRPWAVRPTGVSGSSIQSSVNTYHMRNSTITSTYDRQCCPLSVQYSQLYRSVLCMLCRWQHAPQCALQAGACKAAQYSILHCGLPWRAVRRQHRQQVSSHQGILLCSWEPRPSTCVIYKLLLWLSRLQENGGAATLAHSSEQSLMNRAAEELCERFALFWRHEHLHDAGTTFTLTPCLTPTDLLMSAAMQGGGCV